MSEITMKDMVRAHDFEDRMRIGRGACYVEGRVVGIHIQKEGCARYAIEVTREVWNGEEIPRTAAFSKVGRTVYPPMNGIPTTMGGITNFVEKL